MKYSPFFSCLAALFIFQCGEPSADAAGTNAVITYRMLDDVFQPIAKIDPAKLQVWMFVASTNKSVHPSDITLTLHSASRGLISLPLGTNGQILKFPHDPELVRENPSFVANQPKGTLQLTVTIQLPLPVELTFPYRRLGDGVAEANKSIREQAGLALSWFAPKADGVVFSFSKASAGKATVEIAAAAGKKKYTADHNGQVTLKLEKPLLAENPEVKVSEKPVNIAPDLE